MENIKFVQALQPHNHLDDNFPDVLLLELSVGLLVRDYFLVQVAVVGEFHYDTE